MRIFGIFVFCGLAIMFYSIDAMWVAAGAMLMAFVIFAGGREEDKKAKAICDAADEDYAIRLAKGEDLIWSMNMKDLLLIDPERVFLESRTLITDRIHDFMEIMTHSQQVAMIPFMKRYHPELIDRIKPPR